MADGAVWRGKVGSTLAAVLPAYLINRSLDLRAGEMNRCA
jgi:hypothetical protein